MDFTEKEKKFLSINAIEALDKMKTFIKRGNINSPRNWLLKSNLSSAFQDLFKNVESIGFLKVQSLIEPFMEKDDYKDMLLKDLDYCMFRAQNSELANSRTKILDDLVYQNEMNVTPRFNEILKLILIDHRFDVLVKQKELLKDSYELSLEKFNSSKKKNQEPVNPEHYKLRGLGFIDFSNLVTFFGNSVYEEANKRNLVDDILSMETGYYLDTYSNSDVFSKGNIAQAIFLERCLNKSFAKFDRNINNNKKREDIFSVVLDKFLETPNFGKIIDEKKLQLGTIVFKRPFDELAILDKNLLSGDFKSGNNSRFVKDISTSAVVEFLLISCCSKNGLESIAKNQSNSFDLSTTSFLNFWGTLNSLNENVKSKDIKDYLTFLAFRAINDEEFFKNYIDINLGSSEFKEKKKNEIESFLNSNLTSEEQLNEIKELLINYNVILKLNNSDDYDTYATEEVDGIKGRPQKIAELLEVEENKYKEAITPGVLKERIVKNMNGVAESDECDNDNGSIHFKI